MLNGDVPESHKKLTEELQKMEIEMDAHNTLSPQYTAQSYVCLAHDWYDIGSDEEGRRLLQKAEIACPDYFRKYMKQHTIENPTYNLLVQRLFALLGWQIIDSLKDKK